LVALGNIGRAVARRAKPFGFEVIAYDPYLDPALAAEVDVPLVTLEEVMSRSNFISVHVPLNDETYGMIGAKELGMMKPTAYIVNTARGGVISESALYDVLKNGSIAGAGVDVWENELELSHDHPLLEFDNLIATPHVAYYSEASLPTLQGRVAEAAADVLLGVRPRHVANPEVLQRVHLKPRPDS
jgi:D-3-phosphoglycerate dehydrogenase